MKTLYVDIETSPIVADVWGLWQQNIGLNQIHEATRMICFAAKWAGKGEPTQFWAARTPVDQYEMVVQAHTLLNEADQVVTWNGDSFDIPHLNREFLHLGLTAPSPYKSLDLYRQVKRKFKFPSNKLQYVSTALGFKGKHPTGGHTLWRDCLRGDLKAWRLMEKYNKQDVVLLEQIHDRLGSWVDGLNANLFGGDGCPRCGSVNLVKEGFSYTQVGRYQRYCCRDCGGWSTSGKRDSGTEFRMTK